MGARVGPGVLGEVAGVGQKQHSEQVACDVVLKLRSRSEGANRREDTCELE